MYAVVDTETTGLSPSLRHRVVEIAVVLVDANGTVEDSWCTLLNPARDLGPQHIHGIRAAEVLHAPTFEDIAAHLRSMLSCRILVGHNVAFDLLFLAAEYERLGQRFPIQRDMGLCTMRWASQYLPGAGRSLRECCSAASVPLTGWHSAMSDAQATAGLLRHYLQTVPPPPPWSGLADPARDAAWPTLAARPFHTCTRGHSQVPPSPTARSLVARLVDRLPRVESSPGADPYLAVLDQTLVDRYLSADEGAALAALAANLGLTVKEVEGLHLDYLNALARLALADGHLSEEEVEDLRQVADILGLPAGTVEAALHNAETPPGNGTQALSLQPGDVVVFTGDMQEPRELWLARAADHGLVPSASVTKKVRLVVAADPDSLSGKARKARDYGIPVISIDRFRDAFGYPGPRLGDRQDTTNWSQSEREWSKGRPDRPGRGHE